VLEELLAIAESESLSGREPYRSRSIHWFIDLDSEGNLIGFTPTAAQSISRSGVLSEETGKRFQTPANYHTQVKDGELNSVCTNQHNWLPDFLTGPANELFTAGVPGAQANIAKQEKCRQLIIQARKELPANPSLKAIVGYLDKEPQFPDWLLPVTDDKRREILLKRFAEGKENISFRVNGRITVQDAEVKQWWAKQIEARRNDVLTHLPEGSDFYLPESGRLAEYFPSVFGNIPFASFDRQPFESYGLGKQTTSFRIETAEKAAAALNWLLAKENGCRIPLGDLAAIFWARVNRKIRSTGFGNLMVAADPLQVKDFINGVWGGQFRAIEQADFYAVLLSTSPGRFAVRSWHTETLREAEANLRSYFRAISLPRLNDPEAAPLPIPVLATATIQRSKKSRPQPSVYIALFESALFGVLLPHSLLVAALIRQRVELAKGPDRQNPNEFDRRLAARTAIIQLYFLQRTKGEFMPDEQFNLENDPSYLCGRLLALLDKIHIEAHRDSGGTNSSPANRVYGSASTTPALIFPQLMRLTRIHLNKIKNKGRAYNLEQGIPMEKRADGIAEDFAGLATICARLQMAATQGFPRTLNLEEQGRFAIGFYYERCRAWPPTKQEGNGANNTNSNNQPE